VIFTKRRFYAIIWAKKHFCMLHESGAIAPDSKISNSDKNPVQAEID